MRSINTVAKCTQIASSTETTSSFIISSTVSRSHENRKRARLEHHKNEFSLYFTSSRPFMPYERRLLLFINGVSVAFRAKIFQFSFIILDDNEKYAEAINRTRALLPECKQKNRQKRKSLTFSKEYKVSLCLKEIFALLRVKFRFCVCVCRKSTQFRLIIVRRAAHVTFYVFLHTSNHFSLTISLIFHPLRFSLTIPSQKINNFLCKFGVDYEIFGVKSA